MNQRTITRGIFDVTFRAVPETDLDPRTYFDQDGEQIAADIEAGIYQWFEVLVTASLDGVVLGHSGLGGCCYVDLDDFMQNSGCVHDLSREACAEATAKLKSLCERHHAS